MRRHPWLFVIALFVIALFIVTLAAVVAGRRQLRARQQADSKALYVSMFNLPGDPAEMQPGVRQRLFDELRPVALENCDLERFGEPADGGYLLCANLLGGAETGYSYGIAGYDQWGCDVSTRQRIPVHQYDCFDLHKPACASGHTVFHAECVGDRPLVNNGRKFDTLQNQFAANGDAGRRVVLKMDVEGAEWDSLLHAPDAALERIEQMSVEFHGVHDEKFVRTIWRLKTLFWIAHVHFNNYSCLDGLAPFPAWAYEVLFVNKRLANVDADRARADVRAPVAPNNPAYPDCQAASR